MMAELLQKQSNLRIFSIRSENTNPFFISVVIELCMQLELCEYCYNFE